MKKKVVSFLALAGLCAALFSGCGQSAYERDSGTAPTASPSPIFPDVDLPEAEELIPDVLEPDIRDGIVEDRDGIITEDDHPARNDAMENSRDNGVDTERDSDDNRIPNSGTVEGTARDREILPDGTDSGGNTTSGTAGTAGKNPTVRNNGGMEKR